MAEQEQKKRAPKFMQRADALLKGVSRGARVFAVSLCVITVLLFGAWTYVNTRFFAPVNSLNVTAIQMEIPRGSSVATIARLLEENGVIRSSAVFRILVDIYDRGSKLKAGSYEFDTSMTLIEVLNKISAGETSNDVIQVFLPEGATVADLANALENLGLIQSEEAFVSHMQDPSAYEDFSFLSDVAQTSSERIVAMEGYLFPDTYQVFNNASEQTIVNKFLRRFDDIFSTSYRQRAEQLNMSIDEVVTLASIIQNEAKEDDFKRVSAVFHNRLSRDMLLGSDVTVQYVLSEKKLNLSEEEISVDSPYNTYKYKGLPPGPICNPGKSAIEAALWPDETFIEDEMLYFCLADPATGELVFAKTLSEHNKNVAKYRPLWEEYDATH